MKSTRFSILALLLVLATLPLFAQNSSDALPCATVGKSEWLTRYQAGEVPPVQKSLMTQYVPMRINIVGENDGSGYINPNIFLEGVVNINNSFREMNIQFYVDGSIKYINKSNFNTHQLGDSPSRQAIVQNNVRNKMNIYVVETPGQSGGYYSPSLNAIVLRKIQTGGNSNTPSHEIGHFFSLPHTFYGWEGVGTIEEINLTERAPESHFLDGGNVAVERVDGSNCEDAADGFCDTPPDYLMEGWQCNGLGFYQDSLTDPDSMRFAVPATNFMSYAMDNCQEGFSPEQKTAMLTNLSSRIGLTNTSGEGAVAANGADVQLQFPENNATLPNSDFVEFNWKSVSNADFYVVQINRSNNFNGAVLSTFFTNDTFAIVTEGLIPESRYYWRVRPVNRYIVESDFGEIRRFRNGEFTVATIDAALDAAITVVPNPVSGGSELRIDGRDLGESGNLNYDLIDATGRILLSKDNLPVSASGFSQRILTANLPAGIYFLRLRLNDKLVTRRVMVRP